MTREDMTELLSAVSSPESIGAHLAKLDGESEAFQVAYLESMLRLDAGWEDVPRDKGGRWGSGGGETAKTPADHREAHRYHAEKSKEAWKAGDKRGYKRHGEASDLHLQAASQIEKEEGWTGTSQGRGAMTSLRAQYASKNANGNMK
jgi:hypothetical protein